MTTETELQTTLKERVGVCVYAEHIKSSSQTAVAGQK